MLVRVIAGCSLADLQPKALPPYAPEAVAFLTAWSKQLLARPDIRAYPDAASFAYWCRRANLARLQRALGREQLRMGRGVALHIAPANVPVNFAYSFAFGLLSGNANIVRVPESLPAQADVLCAVAKDLLTRAEHARIAAMTTLLSYPRDDAITQCLSAVADVRLLWGGDQTIQHLRRMPASPRCVDIAFADRYSLCLLSAPAVLAAESKALQELSADFYNDVFLLDQNACSSPHLILWQGTAQEVEAAQVRFWNAMQALLHTKGQSSGIHAVDKYTHLCRTAIQVKGAKATPTADNRVFRVALPELPENIAEHRGRFGFFFETIDNDLEQLRRIVNTRYQTLTCFGVDPNVLAETVVSHGLAGIDRVVPVGKALDIGVIWDGYDLIRNMSRIVATQ
ncbi:MAG: acyl-CoA reductase [Proteobacteria bacterium]|nr:acyl-CoA reductase [Pseudomonadota bacterium]